MNAFDYSSIKSSELRKAYRNHKKWKDSLEGSLDRVIFAAELE